MFFASFIALVHTHGYNVDFVPNYIMAYIRNFVMALPVQLFIVGPLARKIGFNTMLISQDEIRRNMLWVKDGIDMKALPLMIELLKYGNEHSVIVILEGIM